MQLTRGEKLALWCVVPIVIGLLPPVTGWAAGVEARVLGLPFLLFWNTAMVAATALLLTLALVIKDRVDGS
jgi:hypothetical protein